MRRPKRLYRVVAHFGDETKVRDYQTMEAARHRAQVVTGPRAYGYPHAADRVEIWVSEPVVFSQPEPRAVYIDGVYLP